MRGVQEPTFPLSGQPAAREREGEEKIRNGSLKQGIRDLKTGKKLNREKSIERSFI